MFVLFEEIKWLLIKKKLQAIKLLVLDVDGVMTDGFLYYDEDGKQLKRFSVKDGLGIRFLQKAEIEISIISGGKGTAAEKIAALEAAGIEVANSPADMGAAMKRAIEKAS